MRGRQRKNGINLRAWVEEGDLLPGMGTREASRGVWRPAWGRRRHRRCSCPPHRLPGPQQHKARAPAGPYLRPDLEATQLNSISSALLQNGWVVPPAPRGILLAPLFRGPLTHCSPFWARIFSDLLS